MTDFLYFIGLIIALFFIADIGMRIRYRIGYKIGLGNISFWIERHIRAGMHKCTLFLRHRKSGHCLEFYKWAPRIGLPARDKPSKYYFILREGKGCRSAEFSDACRLLDNKSVDYKIRDAKKDNKKILKARIEPDISLATDLATSIYSECFSLPSNVTLRACLRGNINWHRHKFDISGWTDPQTKKIVQHFEQKQYKGNSDLHLGAKQKSPALSKSEIEKHKGDIDMRNDHGATPLMTASYFGNYDAAEILLREGASVRACDKTRRTALHCAAWKGHADIVELLLNYNAPREVKDKKGKTPLDLARENDHTDIVQLLSREK